MPRHTFTVSDDHNSPAFALAALLTQSGGFRHDALEGALPAGDHASSGTTPITPST